MPGKGTFPSAALAQAAQEGAGLLQGGPSAPGSSSFSTLSVQVQWKLVALFSYTLARDSCVCLAGLDHMPIPEPSLMCVRVRVQVGRGQPDT